MWHDADDAFCCEVYEMRAGCRACLWRKHVTGRAARVVSSSRSSVVPCVLRVLHRPCLSSPCRSVAACSMDVCIAALHGCRFVACSVSESILRGLCVVGCAPLLRAAESPQSAAARPRCVPLPLRTGVPALPFGPFPASFLSAVRLVTACASPALDALLGAMTVLSRERKRVTRSKKTDLFAATTLFETPRGKSLY